MIFFKDPISITISFFKNTASDNQDKGSTIIRNNCRPMIYRLEDKEVRGSINISLDNNKPFAHKGIAVAFEGYVQGSKSEFQVHFFKKITPLEDKGVLNEDKTFEFSFDDFPRPVETCENEFGKVRYVVKAIVYRDFWREIVTEKDIEVQLNLLRPETHRVHRLAITCEGNLRIILQQDKKNHYLTDCLVGSIFIDRERPRLKSLSLSLIRKDECRLHSGAYNEKENLIDFVNLSSELERLYESQDESIPFKVPFGKHNLMPTSRFCAQKFLFSISYVLKLRFQEEGGKAWLKDVKINLWRDI